jgi:ATP-dependent Clp protease ATP-binding subunit ClpC
MPKINVYLPDELADAVKDAKLPVSAICQNALEKAVRDVRSASVTDVLFDDEDEPRTGLFSRFTPRAKAALKLARDSARAVPHNYVGTEHVLLGLLDEGGNLAIKVLDALDIEADDLRAELVASMGKPTKTPDDHIPFTPLAKRALEETAKEALLMAHNYIGCEHILLGIVAVEDGLGSQVLKRMGVDQRSARRAVVAALAGYVQAMGTTASTPAPDDTLAKILERLDAIEARLAS